MKLTDKAIIKALKEGKYIKRSYWHKVLSIKMMVTDDNDSPHFYNRLCHQCLLDYNEIYANDWEVVEDANHKIQSMG